jgi:hypothetical protein
MSDGNPGRVSRAEIVPGYEMLYDDKPFLHSTMSREPVSRSR